MVMVPSLPTGGPGLAYAHEMHWPPVYLSSVAVKTLLRSRSPARALCCCAFPAVALCDMVIIEGLGCAAGEDSGSSARRDCGSSQAGRYLAQDVDRRH